MYVFTSVNERLYSLVRIMDQRHDVRGIFTSRRKSVTQFSTARPTGTFDTWDFASTDTLILNVILLNLGSSLSTLSDLSILQLKISIAFVDR